MNMTSSILAQKLASVKLSESEFMKTRWLRADNMEEKLKIGNSLRKIINEQACNKTCRLCLRPGGKRIIDKDQDFDFAYNIKYILGIEVTETDDKPQHICSWCEKTLKDAERLKQTAETTQWRLQQELDMVKNTVSECDVAETSSLHGGYFVEQGSKVVRQWTCGKCRKHFTNQEQFNIHEKQPSCRNNKSYVCETCGLELKTLTRLKRHRLIHTGELQYECERCEYRARTKYALAVHLRRHSGARPAACALCPATFPSASSLASHRRRHAPPQHRCHACDNTFRFKEALRNHIASKHSTVKPHICKACGKAFATRKMICRHERRVHNRPRMRSGIMPTYLRQRVESGT